MSAADTERQISQMVEFIKQEAKEKADEIRVKADEEFNIQRLEFLEAAKLSIREEFRQKEADIQTQKKM
jgi:V-type H+-transporting ATPase subunit E